MNANSNRIGILDGFRAIAILSVLLFHFFSRWAPPFSPVSLYPYDGQYSYFGRGSVGVQFFFIISGFVIFFTLDKTNNFKNFWKKRLIRLVPSMVIATLITFVFFSLLDSGYLFPNSHKIRNLIPSLTFIQPNLFNQFPRLFGSRLDYITGAYWSLWVEIQFYFLASVLYYTKKEQFLRNFIVISLFFIAIHLLFSNIAGSNLLHIKMSTAYLQTYNKWEQIFNLILYLPFFCMGALFYLLFKNKQLEAASSSFIKISLGVFLLCSVFSGVKLEVRFIYIAMFLLFMCFIYYPNKISFFENKILTGIGVCSYFLYLIHENIGVFLINKLGHYFSPVGFVFTLAVICLLIYISWLYTQKIDNPINRKLKNLINTR